MKCPCTAPVVHLYCPPTWLILSGTFFPALVVIRSLAALRGPDSSETAEGVLRSSRRASVAAETTGEEEEEEVACSRAAVPRSPGGSYS